MDISTVTIRIPQFSTRNPTPILSATGTFTNATNLTEDPTFRSLFSVTQDSKLLSLTNSFAAVATPGTSFLLTDSDPIAGNRLVNLIIKPPTFTIQQDLSVTTSIVIQQGYNPFPVTFVPPSNATGVIQCNWPSTDTPVPSVINGTSFSGNPTFVPPLEPIGLRFSNNLILGKPRNTRPATAYSQYIYDSSGNQIRTDFTIQITPFKLTYSTTDPSASVVGSNAFVRLTPGYNDIEIDFIPNLPAAEFVSYSGTMPLEPIGGLSNFLFIVGQGVRLIGNLNSPFDSGSGVLTMKYREPTSGVTYSNLKLNFQYSLVPYVTITPTSPTIQFYTDVPYTIDLPFQTFNAQYYPSATEAEYSWSISPEIDGVTLSSSGKTARLFGQLGNISTTTTLTVTASGIPLSTPVTLSAVPDSITFAPRSSYTAIQNKEITDLFFRASASSGSLVSITSDPAFASIDRLIMLTDGNVYGTPRDSGTTQFSLQAETLEGVRSSAIPFTLVVSPDVITYSASGLASATADTPLLLLQGRDSSFDYTTSQRTLQASATSGNDVDIHAITSGSPGSGMSFSSRGVLSGIPTFTGDLSFTVQSTIEYGNVSASRTIYLRSISDTVVFTNPAFLDFVLKQGDTSNVQLQATVFSGTPITSYSVTTALPSYISVTPTGLLTLSGLSPTVDVFTIVAHTATGTALQSRAKLTVNRLTTTFITPPAPTTVYLSNLTDTYRVETSPPYAINLLLEAGRTGFTISGGFNIVRTSSSDVYNPILGELIATEGVSMPIRLATRSLDIESSSSSFNWIEYAPVSPICITVESWNAPVYVLMRDVPPGMRWDPVRSELSGSPRGLTLNGSFTVVATDGFVFSVRTFHYTVRAPAFLRGFSAPSAYTNYVRQVAIVNSAYHAIDRTAVLPDPLIASENGPYPSDISKDVICCPP